MLQQHVVHLISAQVLQRFVVPLNNLLAKQLRDIHFDDFFLFHLHFPEAW